MATDCPHRCSMLLLLHVCCCVVAVACVYFFQNLPQVQVILVCVCFLGCFSSLGVSFFAF